AEEIRNGSRALRAVGFGGDAWRTQLGSDAFETEVNVEYIASMWIKAQAGSPGVGGTVRFSTAPNALYGPDFTITTEWQKVEWTFTSNETATQLLFDLGFVEDAVYFIDDVSVLAPPPPPPRENLLLNNGFEEGAGDDFTNWTKMNGPYLLT